MLKLCEIVKNYPTATNVVHALKGVSLTFREHELVAILGPSGCGKTTMLNIIGGLDRYTSGDLVIGGVSTADFDDMHWDAYRNSTIGFVFQSYNLIPHLTVLENVELALSLVGEKKKVRRVKATEALKLVGMGGEVNKRPNQLSGGQMQRVAIARAIVNDPKIILADEPTGALDSELSVQVMEILRKISETRLVIMVTHNAELADEYATRICRFKDGELIEDTNPFIDESETEQTSLDDLIESTISESAEDLATTDTVSEAETSKSDEAQDEIVVAEDEKQEEKVTEIEHIEVDLDEPQAIKKQSNRKRKKKMKKLNTSTTALFDKLGLNNLNKQKKKKKSGTKAFKPTAMSAGMAFGLSLKNLVSKRRRTILTAFAGSIGIIGLGLVLSIYNGFNIYINKMQTEMLAGVPLGMYEYNIEPSAVMNVAGSMTNLSPNLSVLYPDTKQIFLGDANETSSSDSIGAVLTQFFKSVSKNDLNSDFDAYIRNMPKEYSSAISVFYGIRYNLVGFNAHSNEYFDASQTPKKSQIMTIALSVLSEGGLQPSYWQQLVGGKDGMMANYDMIDGRYPENQNELLLSIGPDNQIDKNLLKNFFGSDKLYDSDGNEIAEDNLTASSFIGRTVKLVHNNDYFKLDGGIYNDPYETFNATEQNSLAEIEEMQARLEEMYNSAGSTELKIVGVIRPKKSAAAKYVTSSALCYTPELATHVVNEAFTSNIAKDQQALDDAHTGGNDHRVVTGGTLRDSNLATGTSITTALENSLDYTSFEKAIGAIKDPTFINIYPSTYEQKLNIGKYVKEWNTKHDGNVGYLDVSEMFIYNMTKIIDLVSSMLIVVASISLVVSTVMIGVITSNSVVERTREIGILRAIGARKRDIRNVFIAETSIIGLTGGVIGIVLTYILCPIFSLAIGAVTGVTSLLHFHPLHAFILVVLSLGLTIVSGILPAINASRKNVVDALRVE